MKDIQRLDIITVKRISLRNHCVGTTRLLENTESFHHVVCRPGEKILSLTPSNV